MVVTPITIESIEKNLREHRHETARRHCLLALQKPATERKQLSLLLHQAYRQLGDMPSACELLEHLSPENDDERLAITLLLAEDFHLVSSYDFYRGSKYADAGLTGEEYEVMQQKRAFEYFAKAIALATTDARRRQVADVLMRCNRKAEAKLIQPTAVSVELTVVTIAPAQTGILSGILHYAAGGLATRCTITLGLAVDVTHTEPNTYLEPVMGNKVRIGKQQSITTVTDEHGRFRFDTVPAGRHEFLAVSLDPKQYAICTRFLAHNIIVTAGEEVSLKLTVDEWQSAPPREITNPFHVELLRNGVSYNLVHQEILGNPFYFNFDRQPVSFTLPAGVPANGYSFLLLSSAELDQPQPFQLTGNIMTFFTELPQCTDRVFALYQAEKGQAEQVRIPPLVLAPDADGQTATVNTGRATFRLPFGEGTDSLPPLLAVCGENDVWRGQGRFILPDGVSITGRKTEVLDCGPLVLVVRVSYTLSNGKSYAVEFTAHRDEAYLLTREICLDVPGMAFEFSLPEFSGGRGFLHWTPESGNRHWSDLTAETRELARLQESVAWWIPPQGFGYAMTPADLNSDVYIGIFTIRRGEWIDRKFASITNGPTDNYELDWPYPEMVGSTVSMITVHTTTEGDAYFRFKAFDGERRWGILASTFERNDGPFKEISAVQHKNSSPRLQIFKDWHLDMQDGHQRPSVVISRDMLREAREKMADPIMGPYWQKIVQGLIPGPVAGVRFAIEGDPLVAWRMKCELVDVAQIRAKMTLLGRDFSDMYSPVGARPITPWAEQYDLIAASGVFTPAEEQLVRSFLMLMGHMYMETDHMNWKFNGRNTNFEADRIDVVGAVALTFSSNPDSAVFIPHVSECLANTLRIYTTPGSGKWYENPACYYLSSLKCRMNLAFHLAKHGFLDPTKLPRIKDFLSWGINLATPRFPTSYELLTAGATDAEYRTATQARRIPPIGDHAHLGLWFTEFHAMMASLLRESDPAFADLLLWSYQSGGADGGYFGNIPLMFSQLKANDLQPVAEQTLSSRILEGFGTIFRGNFNQKNEFYLLFKLGPGGYRYQRTEGSIIMFADGKPLIYDGGEAGETWRHSTLSFHDTHMPLAPGHIERFQSFPGVDFTQGVNPKALNPGEPVFLSDLCDDYLVDVAYARFNEPNPENSRSMLWVKDEYVIMHDELDFKREITTHWHLQVVADKETGNAADGYRFVGRYGTDLQVLLPNQTFSAELIESVRMLEYNIPPEKTFTLRHLQLTRETPDHFLAVLCPLSPGKQELSAKEIRQDGRTLGVTVHGKGIDDTILLSRKGMKASVDDLQFAGRYATVVRRADHTEYTLLDGASLVTPEITIESNGPAVFVSIPKAGGHSEVMLRGQGGVNITREGKMTFLRCDNASTTVILP